MKAAEGSSTMAEPPAKNHYSLVKQWRMHYQAGTLMTVSDATWMIVTAIDTPIDLNSYASRSSESSPGFTGSRGVVPRPQ